MITATIFSSQPQFGQFSRSISKTRLSSLVAAVVLYARFWRFLAVYPRRVKVCRR